MITVFTPTYNRALTIHRVWESLCCQSFKDFEWVVIDDGSTDNIAEVIDRYKKNSEFDIVFHKFENNRGKHNATNKALELANRPFFVVADSDDGFTEDALDFFMNGWLSIPEDTRSSYCGVRACCVNNSGERFSDILSFEPLDASMQDAYYIYKFQRESWCMVRTDLHRKFLFPEDHKDHFYPEGIIWKAMSKHHPLRFFNKATRIYYTDDENSLIREKVKPEKKILRNLIGCLDILNNDIQYLKYQPLYFIRMNIVYTTYSFFNNSILKSFHRLNNYKAKSIFIFLFIPSYFTYLYLRFKQ